MKNGEEFYMKPNSPSSTTAVNSNTNNNATVTEDVSEAILQVTYADRIIINKIDLINENDLITLFQAIKVINKNARILACEYSNIPIDELLNIRAFDPLSNKSLLDNYDENYMKSNSNTDYNSSNTSTTNNNSQDVNNPKIFTTDENGKIILKKFNIDLSTQKKRTTLNFSKINQNALQIIKQKNFKHNISSISLVIYDKPLDLVLFNNFIIKLLKEDGFLIYRLKGIYFM